MISSTSFFSESKGMGRLRKFPTENLGRTLSGRLPDNKRIWGRVNRESVHEARAAHAPI